MSVVAPTAPEKTFSQSPFRRVLRRVVSSPLGLIGVAIIALLILTAIFASAIAPFLPTQMGAGPLRSPPSLRNLFGTDQLGRDVFSQTVYGARLSLWVVGLAVLLAFVLGSAFGLIAGFVGGFVDSIIMRVADAMLAIPAIILALAIVSWLGPDLTNTMLAIAIVNISAFARLVRGEVLSIRSQPFIEATRLQGFSNLRIIARHVWPNVTGNVLVFASLTASQALITEAGLSFLGLGVQPPNPSWGRMVATGIDYYQYWWMSFFPGAAIFVVVISLNFLGDAFRDAADKRLTGSDVG